MHDIQVSGLEVAGGNICFRTSDFDAARNYIRDTSKGLELKARDRKSKADFVHKDVQISKTRIDFTHLSFGDEFRVEQPFNLDYYSLKLLLSGICEYKIGRNVVTALPGSVYVSNPSQPIPKRFIGTCSQFIVRINKGSLESFLAEELDTDISAPIEFAAEPWSTPATRSLCRLVEFLWHDLGDGGTFRHWRLARQAERMLSLTLLRSMPNNYSAALEQPPAVAAPYYVRRAEEYIHTHAREAVAMSDIVEAAGVSARSLYYGFRRWRNTTPMAYLKMCRLELAREELLRAARNGRNVTDIAVSLGYEALSRFSYDYKTRFGERPSDTLLRGK